MRNINGGIPDRLNKETLKKAKGIYSFPAWIPQFKDGGLVERMPPAYKNAGTQAKDLRYNVQNPPGKTYIQKPDPYAVNVGPQSDYRFNVAKAMAPAAVDSQTVGNVAAGIAGMSQGPYKEKIQAMFPQHTGQSREGSLAKKVLGYKKGGAVAGKPMVGMDDYGMMQGHGTGTSDSIPANLKEGDFIIPANVVQALGEDYISLLMGDVVPAKVSNGEVRLPPERVEDLGLDFLQKLIATVPGEVPETQGYAYGGEVEEDEERKKIDYDYNNRIAGLPDVVGGVKAFNNFFDQSEALRERGGQRPPDYQKPDSQNTAGAFESPINQRPKSVTTQQRPIAGEPIGKDISDPNVYGPNNQNFGPNPTTEQRNQLFGSSAQNQQNELDQFKQYSQAQADIQNEANRKDRLDQQFYLQNYGTQVNSQANVDSGAAQVPRQLSAQREIAGLSNQTELAKANILADVEREKAAQPVFDTRITDSGEPYLFQKSGSGASEQARQQQLSGDIRVKNALKYLQDPNAKPEQKTGATAYLRSLGLI
jgi:hypothetical protein